MRMTKAGVIDRRCNPLAKPKKALNPILQARKEVVGESTASKLRALGWVFEWAESKA